MLFEINGQFINKNEIQFVLNPSETSQFSKKLTLEILQNSQNSQNSQTLENNTFKIKDWNPVNFDYSDISHIVISSWCGHIQTYPGDLVDLETKTYNGLVIGSKKLPFNLPTQISIHIFLKETYMNELFYKNSKNFKISELSNNSKISKFSEFPEFSIFSNIPKIQLNLEIDNCVKELMYEIPYKNNYLESKSIINVLCIDPFGICLKYSK